MLLAARNGAAYLREQLNSILAQRQDGFLLYPENLCLVVSDDCSTDGTGELLDAYAEEHRGNLIVLHRNQPSGGAAQHFLSLLQLMARLAAEEDAKRAGVRAEAVCLAVEVQAGEWTAAGQGAAEQLEALRRAASASCFFLSDQDDVWLPNKVEKQIACLHQLEKTQKSVKKPLLVHSDCSVVTESLQEISKSFFRYQKISQNRTRLSQLLVQNVVTGGAVLLNREFLPLLLRLPRLCLMHDAWLALLCACFGQFGCVEESLYLYRQHGDNTLGAAAAGRPSAGIRRLLDGSRAAENYRRQFAQAEALLELFGPDLKSEQREILEAFLKIPKVGRLQKIRLMLRYGFLKDTWYRSLGLMLMIP